MDALTRAVRTALANPPVSLRRIAGKAGVSHVLLVRIMAGERAATVPVAQAIAKGLREIEYLAGRKAARIERSLTYHRRRQR